MATQLHREPVKIYTFPSRGRAGGSVVKQMSAEEFVAQRVVPMDFGSAWYHDAAVEDDRTDR